MRFSFSAEQEEFRATVRRALEARSPTKEVRRLMATDAGFERDGWQKLNQELGLTALHIPEAYGGGGFGYSELAIVLEEMGRGLLCAPFFSTAALATTAILNAGTEEQKKALLPGLADGTVTATLAVTEEGGSNDAASIALTASPFRRDLAARRHQELRARRPYRRSAGRGGASAGLARRGRDFLLHGRRQRLRPRAAQAQDDGRDAQARASRLPVGRGAAARQGGHGHGSLGQDHAAGADLPRQRDGRRRREAARGRARVRQDAHAVRPLDRLLPDDQEQGRRHAGRCRAGEIRCLLRRRRAR